MLFECMDICGFGPAHQCEMRGFNLLIVKYLLILFKCSHGIFDGTALSWNLGYFLKAFLEGSVDHINNKEYMMNRNSFIPVVACW